MVPSSSSSLTTSALVGSCIAAYTAVILARKRSRKTRTQKVEEKLLTLGIMIPTPPEPKGNYVTAVPAGNNMLHLCGHVPNDPVSAQLIQGKVGKELSVQEGYESARACAVNILGTLHEELDGDWGRIKRVVKVVGYVNCTEDFTRQPQIINGASDLFGEVFGERGVHARVAVGSNALPLNIATEVDCIVELEC